MAQIPDVFITELQNALGILPAGADEIMVVAGCSSKGPLDTPAAYGDVASLVADFGEGPMVEEASLVLNGTDSGTSTPVIVIRTPSSTPGALGTIDVSGVSGTAIASASGTPLDAYEGYLKVSKGGTIGTPGVTLEWSLDNGRTRSPLIALGTNYSVTFGTSGLTIAFAPPAAQITILIAYANAIRSAALAHFTYTTGTVHGASDTTSDDGVHAAATDLPTAILVLTTVTTALGLHFARGTTVHLTADVGTSLAAALAASAAVTASGTAQDAITLALLLETALETHENGASATTYHTIADAVNVVSATRPTRGTLVAGDIVLQPTTEPKWVAADLTSAFDALAAGEQPFGFVQIAGAVNATEAATIDAALAELRSAHKGTWCLVGARGPNAGEDETTWMTAIEADFAAAFSTERPICAGTWRVTSPVSGRVYNRRITGSVAARFVTIPVHVDAAKVALGPLRGGTLFDSNKNLIGHNERVRPGLTAANFITLRTFTVTGLAAYITTPCLMSPPGSDFDLVQKRRVMNVAERVLYFYGVTLDLSAEGTVDPETGFISETSARDNEIDIREALKTALGPAISNPDDPSLFILSRLDPVLSNGGKLTGSSRITPLFYIKNLVIVAGFQKA